MDDVLDQNERLDWLVSAVSSARAEIDRLSAKDAISECIFRYARGIDRIDESLLRSVFHPDAIIDFSPSFKGPLDDWIALSIAHQRSQFQAHHMFGLVSIQVAGDRAVAESYGLARHKNRIDGKWLDLIIAFRTFDRFSRRSGEWKISERKQVTDWARTVGISDGNDLLYENGFLEKGARNRLDASYKFHL